MVTDLEYRRVLHRMLQVYVFGTSVMAALYGLDIGFHIFIRHHLSIPSPIYGIGLLICLPFLALGILNLIYSAEVKAGRNNLPKLFSRPLVGPYHATCLGLLWPLAIVYSLWRLSTPNFEEIGRILSGERKRLAKAQEANPLLAEKRRLEAELVKINGLPPEEKSSEEWRRAHRVITDAISAVDKVVSVQRTSEAKVKAGQAIKTAIEAKEHTDAFLAAYLQEFNEGHGQELENIAKRLMEAFQPDRVEKISKNQLGPGEKEVVTPEVVQNPKA